LEEFPEGKAQFEIILTDGIHIEQIISYVRKAEVLSATFGD
jgi:hypothetical protein